MPLNNLGLVEQRSNGAALYRAADPIDSFDVLQALGVDIIISLNRDELAESIEDYSGIIDYHPIPTFSVDIRKIESIVKEIDDALNDCKNVLIHCAHGRDRTGLVVGAYRLIVNDWNLDQVSAERKKYGVNWFIDIFDYSIRKALKKISIS